MKLMIDFLIALLAVVIGIAMLYLDTWLERRHEKPYSDKERLWNRVEAITLVREQRYG